MVKKQTHLTFYEQNALFFSSSLLKYSSLKKTNKQCETPCRVSYAQRLPVPCSANAAVHSSSAFLYPRFSLFLVFSPPLELAFCLQRGAGLAHVIGGVMKGDSNSETISREIG